MDTVLATVAWARGTFLDHGVPVPACYLVRMNGGRGRVCGGHIELDTALPEGAEVVVLTADSQEPFDLDEAQLSELEARMAAADRGEVEPAAAVLERLRRGR